MSELLWNFLAAPFFNRRTELSPGSIRARHAAVEHAKTLDDFVVRKPVSPNFRHNDVASQNSQVFEGIDKRCVLCKRVRLLFAVHNKLKEIEVTTR